MTDEPRRMGADFDSIARARQAMDRADARVGQTRAATATALRVLVGANLSPVYGFDQDDAERLWSASLTPYDPEAVVSAARAWVGMLGVSFPSLAAFEALVAEKHRAMHRRSPLSRAIGAPCPECGNSEEEPTDGWVTLSNPMEGGTGTSRPCEQCNPARFDAWQRKWRRRRFADDGEG